MTMRGQASCATRESAGSSCVIESTTSGRDARQAPSISVDDKSIGASPSTQTAYMPWEVPTQLGGATSRRSRAAGFERHGGTRSPPTEPPGNPSLSTACA
jgi:hypothetical protein